MFSRKRMPTRRLLRISTTIPSAKSPANTLRSSAFPSMYGSSEPPADAALGSHSDTTREAARNSQVHGIHRARDVRSFRLRSSRNSPEIPAAKTILASSGVMAFFHGPRLYEAH